MRPLQGGTVPLQGARRPYAAPGRPRAPAAPPRRAARRVRAAAGDEGEQAAWQGLLASLMGEEASQPHVDKADAARRAMDGVPKLTAQLQAQLPELAAAAAAAEQRHAELIAEFQGLGASRTAMDGRPAAAGVAAAAAPASRGADEAAGSAEALAAAAAGVVRAYAAVQRDCAALLLERLVLPASRDSTSWQYMNWLLCFLSTAADHRSKESSIDGSSGDVSGSDTRYAGMAPAFLPALDALLAPPPGPPQAGGATGGGPGGAGGGSGEGQQAASPLLLLDAALRAVLAGEAPEEPAGEAFRGSSFPTADAIRCGDRGPAPRLLKHALATLRNVASSAAVPAALSRRDCARIAMLLPAPIPQTAARPGQPSALSPSPCNGQCVCVAFRPSPAQRQQTPTPSPVGGPGSVACHLRCWRQPALRPS
jgi:hypothetical protein